MVHVACEDILSTVGCSVPPYSCSVPCTGDPEIFMVAACKSSSVKCKRKTDHEQLSHINTFATLRSINSVCEVVCSYSRLKFPDSRSLGKVKKCDMVPVGDPGGQCLIKVTESPTQRLLPKAVQRFYVNT